MADLNVLYDALRQAHAAGDVQSATKLADYIRSLGDQTPVVAPPPSKERTWGEALKDIGAGAVSGAGALVQLPGQLYGLATGDMSETGALGLGKEIQQYGEEMKSAGLKAREQARAEKIAQATEKGGQMGAFGAALGETLKDPGLLLNFLAEQAPQLVVPFGAGKLGAGAARLAGAGAKAGTVGTGAAVGAGAAAQGADVGAGAYEDIYKELKSKGIPDAEAAQSTINLARAAGASGAVLSLLANALPGARQLEKIAAGVPGKGGKLAMAGKTVLGEIPSENIEEVGGKLAQNIAMQQVKPEQKLTEGLGETAAMATLGAAGMGTAAGALSRKAPEPPPPPKAEEKPEEPVAPPREEPTITPPVSLTGRTGAQLLQDQIRGEQNVGLMDAARVRGEEQEAIREQERKAAEKEQAQRDQEERDRQAAMQAAQERARGLGLEGGTAANERLIAESRLRAEEEGKRRKKEEADRVKNLEAQFEAERKRIESTRYSADQVINERRRAAALAELEARRPKPAEKPAEKGPSLEEVKPAELPKGTNVLRGLESRNEPLMSAIQERRAAQEKAAQAPAPKPLEGTESDLIGAAREGVQKRAEEKAREDERRAKEKAKEDERKAKEQAEQDRMTQEAIDQIIEPEYQADIKASIKQRLGLDQKEKEKKASPFLSFLKEYGINLKEASDVTGGGREKFKGLRPGTLRADGLGMDQLAMRALEQGYLTQQEFDSDKDNGGVNKLMEKIQKEIAGEQQLTTGEASEEAAAKYDERQLEDLQKMADQYGIDTTGMPPEKISSQIRRVERKIQERKAKQAESESKAEAEAKKYLAKVEAKRDQYERESRAFAELSTEQQDRLLDVILDEEGNPSVVDRKQAEVEAAAVEDLGEAPTEEMKSSSKGQTYQPNPEELRIQNELRGKSLLQVAQWTVDNSPNSFQKLIMEKVQRRLREMDRRGVKFEFKIHEGAKREKRMRDCLGVTRLSWGESAAAAGTRIAIELNGVPTRENQRGYPPGVNYETVAHELLHAATRAQLRFLRGDPLVAQLKDLFAKVKAQVEIDRKAGTLPPVMQEFLAKRNNALDNIDEMVSWGLTDQEMQKYLDGIEVGKKSAFTRMIELIREVMGIGKAYESALERLARTTEDILDVNIKELEGGITSVGVSYGPGKARKPTITGDVLMQEEMPSVVGAAKAVVQKKLQPKPTKNVVGIPQDLKDKADKSFGPHKKKTIIDRIEESKDRFWQRMAQGIADQYRTIKEYSKEAYMMARMSKTIDGALEGIMFNGEVFNNGGALDIKPNTKGFIEILSPLGDEVDNYMQWVALNREAQLVEKKRIPSIDPELVARRNEFIAGEINGRPRKQVYEEVRDEMNKLNRSVLKVALDAGLIDQNGYDNFAADVFYIPFYKAMEDGDLSGAKTASGLARQEFSKMLKGGEKPFGDLMENTLRNWSHILSASMKNQAANASLEAAEKLGAATVADSSETGTVKVMKEGRPVYYKVNDPLLLDAITSIGYMGPKSKFLDVARDFKNMLQFGVTISPAFKVRNLIRDSVSAMAISDLKKNPVANVIEGINLTDKNNPYYMSALAGGAIFNFGSAYEGQQAKMVKRLVEMGVDSNHILDSPEKIKNALKSAWNKYQDLGNKSEAANRMALYKQMRDKNMSHLEAAFYARDLLDFSMQGSFPAFRFLTQVVPFLNTRIQGLYKLGKDGINPTARVIYNTATGKPIDANDKVRAQSFSIVSAAVGLASLALYAAFKDDEEFKKRDDWDRDNFWWFRLPGMDYAFRIPKPFEIGAFGTLIERTMDQIYDEGAEGKDFVKAIERMATDTFAFNLPQVIKPMVDIYANRDSFTGSPIESAGMERLSKAERVADNTSPLAIALGGIANVFLPEKMELSPVQVDYLIKGYFGWMGAQAAWTSHYAVMPFQEGTRPDNKWTDTMSAGFVRSLPSTQSRYVNAFYENSKEISQAYADMRHYAEIGDAEKVQQLITEKGDKIALAKFYDKTSKDMSEVRKSIRAITADPNMDGAEKREEVDRLKLLLAMLAEQAETARKSMKK